MPGEYLQDVRIYTCGSNPDGSPIRCTEIGWFKVPFGTFLAAEDESNVTWRPASGADVHIPLKQIIAAMLKVGITVSYDEEDLSKRLGPPPGTAPY